MQMNMRGASTTLLLTFWLVVAIGFDLHPSLLTMFNGRGQKKKKGGHLLMIQGALWVELERQLWAI